MELLAAFVGGILGVLGAFAGVWLGNYYQSRAQKQQTLRDNTLSLYTELTSPEMLACRMKASKLWDGYAKSGKPLTVTELGANLDTAFEDWYPVGRVLNFLEKLGVYLKVGHLDEELARELLGGVVLQWYDQYVAHLVVDSVDPSQVNRGDPFQTLDEWLKPYRAQLESAHTPTRG